MANIVRIAMWSGPRNVSTALMRSWENRVDCVVIDEPFYAHYLKVTGRPHPGRAEVIAAQENDWRRVAETLHGPLPTGKRLCYQKHMAHHLLPNMGRDWLAGLKHAFLIRNPREMLLSLDNKLEQVELRDTGLEQQVEIFEMLRRTSSGVPAVVDSRDLLNDPEAILTLLCSRLGVAFDTRMLSWPPGPRASDGVWAKYWYEKVEQSSGFGPYRAASGELPEHLAELERACKPLYDQLYAYRLTT